MSETWRVRKKIMKRRIINIKQFHGEEELMATKLLQEQPTRTIASFLWLTHITQTAAVQVKNVINCLF